MASMADIQMEMGNQAVDHEIFRGMLDGMTSSVSATRESIKKLSTQCATAFHSLWSTNLIDPLRMDTDTKDGISLLSLKHHLMLSYCQALVLLSSHRILGHALSSSGDASSSRETLKSFGTSDRGNRGSEPSDLVNALIEKRISLWEM